MAHLHTETYKEYRSYNDGPGGYTVVHTDRYIVLDSNDEKAQFIELLQARLVELDHHIAQLNQEITDENTKAKIQYDMDYLYYLDKQNRYEQLPWYKRLCEWSPIEPQPFEPQVVTTKLYDLLKSLPQQVELLYNPIPEELYLEVIKGRL